MENLDLRKEANDAIRGIKGELRGAIVLATDCDKNTVCIGGKPEVIVNMLAGTMLHDPNFLTLMHAAMQAVTAKLARVN